MKYKKIKFSLTFIATRTYDNYFLHAVPTMYRPALGASGASTVVLVLISTSIEVLEGVLNH